MNLGSLVSEVTLQPTEPQLITSFKDILSETFFVSALSALVLKLIYHRYAGTVVHLLLLKCSMTNLNSNQCCKLSSRER